MNAWQMAQQIKRLLETLAWPTGDQDAVFGTHGSVGVFAGAPTDEQIPPGFPWALVGIGPATPDQDHPDYLQQQISVAVAAEVAGDRMGEHAIIGGSAKNLGRSAGRGVAEIAYLVRERLQTLTGADGARLVVSHTSSQPIAVLGRSRHAAVLEMDLTAWCTAAPYYTAPQMLRYEGGKWRWDGSQCAARFDFYRYRLVRKGGADPSTSPSDGATIYTGTAAEFTGTQVSGQTYTVFADYNARGVAAVEGSSSAEVGSYRTV